MGLNEAQKKERSEYLEKYLEITECSQRKPYVFISYASDNWETVFKSAVVPMQKKYGLRVYADKAFDKVNDKWIVPMLRNVRGADAMIAFVSQSYIESYACFLELLTAVNNKKQIIFVSLEQQLHLGDTTDQPEVERGVKNEILNQGANIATNTNNTSNDLMRAMKSAFTSISTLLEQDALSKYDISDAFINFFRDASINRKTINDLNAVRGTIKSVSVNVFDRSLINAPVPEAPAAVQKEIPVNQPVQESETGYQRPPQQSQQPESVAYCEPASGQYNSAQDASGQYESGHHDSAQYASAYHEPTQQFIPEADPAGKGKTDVRSKKLKVIAAAVGICLLVVIGVTALSPKTVKDTVYTSGSDTGTYTGQWKNGEPNGQGTIKWENGSVYEGEWKDGIENGQGVYTYVNGDRYEGEMLNGYADGQGTFWGSSGNVYTGEWKNGQPNGQGTMTYANGDRYEGEWKDDYPDGQGTMTYANGDYYEGEWSNGYFNGQGTYTFSNGTVQTGTWQNGNFIG